MQQFVSMLFHKLYLITAEKIMFCQSIVGIVVSRFSFLKMLTCCAMLQVLCVSSLNGQVNPTGSTQNNATAAGTATRTPWRPSFGPIASEKTSSPIANTIPTRQTVQNNGGLAVPNSPYNTAPTGINLQTGTTVPAGILNTSTSAPPSNQQLPGTATPATRISNGTQPASTQTTTQAQNTNPTQGLSNVQGQFVDPQNRPGASGVITRVTKTMNQLPNDAGQVWREYDITPYTSRITGIVDPQQAILNWILKETGTEMWFNQPLGILNADKNQLRVYHTPEIQKIVNQIVDRFVNTRGQVQNLEVSLITIGKPNWRSSAYPVLQPIEVQSPGIEAWMITKENAALLRSSLARRADFQDHGTGKIGQHDGQTVVLRNTKPVQFIRNFRWTGNQVPPYQPLITKIDEGYTLEISSLTSLDGNTVEAAIECRVDQVERLNTVKVQVPGTIGATTDRISLQIPQLVSWRLKERFRWPNDQVLLLSCGVVATPGPQTSLPTTFPGWLGANRKRADALLFVDYRGPQLANGVPGNTARSRTVPVNSRR